MASSNKPRSAGGVQQPLSEAGAIGFDAAYAPGLGSGWGPVRSVAACPPAVGPTGAAEP